jgi:hypothetical protein
MSHMNVPSTPRATSFSWYMPRMRACNSRSDTSGVMSASGGANGENTGEEGDGEPPLYWETSGGRPTSRPRSETPARR